VTRVLSLLVYSTPIKSAKSLSIIVIDAPVSTKALSSTEFLNPFNKTLATT
jgi:predicted nuclease with RNAse H fold